MRTFHFTIYLVLLTPLMFGQTDSLFKVQVGIFKCSPYFKLQDSATLSFANSEPNVYSYYDEKKKTTVTKEISIESQDKFLNHYGPLNSVTFYLPQTTGTSNSYEFINLQDSICLSQLDTFWQSTIAVTNSGTKQKFKSCAVSILYANGQFFNTYIKDPSFLKNKQLSQQLKNSSTILAFSVTEISFKAENKKDYNIGDGFAWKVINCH